MVQKIGERFWMFSGCFFRKFRKLIKMLTHFTLVNNNYPTLRYWACAVISCSALQYFVSSTLTYCTGRGRVASAFSDRESPFSLYLHYWIQYYRLISTLLLYIGEHSIVCLSHQINLWANLLREIDVTIFAPRRLRCFLLLLYLPLVSTTV